LIVREPHISNKLGGVQCCSRTLKMSNENEVYSNPVTSLLGNFIKKQEEPEKSSSPSKEFSIDSISWDRKKQTGLSLKTMSKKLDAGLKERQWFVTGNVMPELFSDDFRFVDPDVSLEGIENYARGVNKLFDQRISKAEVISCQVNKTIPNTITVAWRLEGAVNIGPGIKIKPYVVYTDLIANPKSGLIEFQEDRFSVPSWDILLSSFFPFLIPFLTPPAPAVEELKKQSSGNDS